jgi:hypothetical protein
MSLDLAVERQALRVLPESAGATLQVVPGGPGKVATRNVDVQAPQVDASPRGFRAS